MSTGAVRTVNPTTGGCWPHHVRGNTVAHLLLFAARCTRHRPVLVAPLMAVAAILVLPATAFGHANPTVNISGYSTTVTGATVSVQTALISPFRTGTQFLPPPPVPPPPPCIPPQTGTPGNCITPPPCIPPQTGTPGHCITPPPCIPPQTGTPGHCITPPPCIPPQTGTPGHCITPPPCIPPQTGTPGHCITPPPCIPPQTGTPGHCITPPPCIPPQTGTPGHCITPPAPGAPPTPCPRGDTGQPPNCVPPPGSRSHATSYRGKTSQRQPISFKVFQGGVTGLDLYIRDRCPDGHLLRVHAHGFPRIAVRGNRFGGTFGPRREPTVLVGTFSGTKVTGSIKDSSVSPRTGKLCKGLATFTAAPR